MKLFKVKKGFSLIETAIALVVIGAIVVAGSSYLKSGIKSSKLKETQDLVLKTAGAVNSFSRENQRLPNNLELETLINTPFDSFGNKYIYYYADNLANTGTNNNICNKNTTNLSLIICKDITCNNMEQIDNVSYVIGSAGIDGINQTIAETDNAKKIVKIYPSANNDDIIKWTALNVLQDYTDCNSFDGNNILKIITMDIPPVTDNDPISTNSTLIRIFAEGGVPARDGGYRWCVEYDLKTKIQLLSIGMYFDTTNINNNGNGLRFNPVDSCDPAIATYYSGLALIPGTEREPERDQFTSYFYVYVTDETGAIATKRLAYTFFDD